MDGLLCIQMANVSALGALHKASLFTNLKR